MYCMKCGKNFSEGSSCPTCGYVPNNEKFEPNVDSTSVSDSDINEQIDVQDNPQNQNLNNKSPIKKGGRIKKIGKYLFSIYATLFALYGCFLLIPTSKSSNGLDSLFAAMSSIFGIGIIMIIVSSIVTFNFIKKNFVVAKSSSSFSVILNTLLLYIMYFGMRHFIIFGGDIFSVFVLPILLSLITIPVSHFLNRGKLITRKDVVKVILIVVIAELLVSFENTEYLELNIVYLLFLVYRIIVMIVPAFVAGVVDIEPKNTDHEKSLEA